MRYSHYKPTGIAWLPEIPEGWEMVKVGYCFDENGSGTTPASGVPEYYDGVTNWVQSGDLHGDAIYTTKKTVTEKALDDYSLKIFQPPFICMAMYGASIANVSVVRISACTNQACCVLAKNRETTNLDYLYRCLSSMSVRQVLLLKAQGGTQPNINRGDVLATRIPLPPLSIQRAIVAFLDEKCGKVNRLVAAKEKEVVLLRELKQSMIAEAVTRGVRTNRRLVPSGIPWLPEVPEGWEVLRLKWILNEIKNLSTTGEELPLSLTASNGLIPFSEKANRTMESASYVGAKIVEQGQIVFNRFKARLFAVAPCRGLVSPDYAVYSTKTDIEKQYLLALFATAQFRQAMNNQASGIGDGFSRLYSSELFKLNIPVPPLAEQREIVAHIEARAAKMDAAVAGLERGIAALKEYKQRLIADVVTGQRRVA